MLNNEEILILYHLSLLFSKRDRKAMGIKNSKYYKNILRRIYNAD